MDIATGYSALTAAFEIAKGLKNIDDRVKLNAAVIELQEKILSAQQAATDAKAKMQEMARTIEDFEDWKQTAARYSLKDFGCNTFAFEVREEMLDGQPKHLVCPNCFQQKRISILQFTGQSYGQKQFRCQACDTLLELGCFQPESPSYQADMDWSPFD